MGDSFSLSKMSSLLFVLFYVSILFLGFSNSFTTAAFCTKGMWIGTTWIPHHNCSMTFFTPKEVGKCLHNKNLIFTGNSVSRHLYYSFTNFIFNITEDVDQQARISEKEDMAHAETSPNNECPEREKKAGHKIECCEFNSNHFDNLITKTWELGKYHGNVSFMWMYDWYHPIYEKLLNQSNVVLSPNAGLNHQWAHNKKWDPDRPTDVVREQFPKFWDIPIKDNTTSVVYRQSTKTCYVDVAPTNRIIEEYLIDHTSPQKHAFDMSQITQDMLFYIDCNHHPGPVAVMTLQFIFNSLCPEFNRHMNTKEMLKEFHHTIGWYPVDRGITNYYLIAHGHKRLIDNYEVNKFLLNITTINRVSSSFLQYIPDGPNFPTTLEQTTPIKRTKY